MDIIKFILFGSNLKFAIAYIVAWPSHYQYRMLLSIFTFPFALLQCHVSLSLWCYITGFDQYNPFCSLLDLVVCNCMCSSSFVYVLEICTAALLFFLLPKLYKHPCKTIVLRSMYLTTLSFAKALVQLTVAMPLSMINSSCVSSSYACIIVYAQHLQTGTSGAGFCHVVPLLRTILPAMWNAL